MKIITILLITLLSINSNASKARLEALSLSPDGTYVVDDFRNIFLNPSNVNKLNRVAIIEFGSKGSAENLDEETKPKAEGGFFLKNKMFNYGIYLGREDNEITTVRNSLTNKLVLTPDNTISLFMGKKFKEFTFASALTFSSNETQSVVNATTKLKKSESFVSLNTGISYGKNIIANIKLKLSDEAKGATESSDKFDGSLGLTLGASYKLDFYKLYFQYTNQKYNYSNKVAGTAISTDTNYSVFILGGVINYKMKNKLFFISPRFNYLSLKQDRKGYDFKNTISNLTIVFGLENNINKWLILRASLSQAAFINSSSTDETNKPDISSSTLNTTKVAAGIGLKFKDFNIDGLISTKDGLFSTSNLMHRISFTYNL